MNTLPRERVLPINDGGRSLDVVMLVNGAYPPLAGGGTEMQVRTLARALRKRGHRVTVVAPLIRERSQQRVERDDGVVVVRLTFPKVRLLGGIVLMLRLLLFLLSRRDCYDAWHVHSPRQWAALATLLGSLLAKPQVVVKVASALELERGTLARNPSIRSRAVYMCLSRASAWQAISRRIAEGVAAAGIPAHRIAAIPNAVDTARFRPRTRRAPGDARFIFVGRLVEVKNLPLLLDGFAAVMRSHPRAHLRIVGSGPLESSLKQQASRLQIDSNVEFTGHREDVEDLLADADFGVLPSSVEGLSNTLLECMACGLPMIASRVSGSEDLVANGSNGWLFDPGDLDGLTRCLREAASLAPDELLRFGKEARETVERYASLDSVADRIVVLYRGSSLSPHAVFSATGEAG